MFMMFARFSFKSSDLAAENRNYMENHVRLARQLPGVRMYLTGKLIQTAQGKPDHYRAVLFGYDNSQAGLTSLDCPIGVELMADSTNHIAGTVVSSFEGDPIPPFIDRRPGQPCCVAMLIYNLKVAPDDPRYRSYQDSIRAMPGLCGYITGPTFTAPGEQPDRKWAEARIFSLTEASRRAAGEELVAPDESLMERPLVYCFEGEVQI